eukprot:323822-Pleurochrysis_carterae.AAC.1
MVRTVQRLQDFNLAQGTFEARPGTECCGTFASRFAVILSSLPRRGESTGAAETSTHHATEETAMTHAECKCSHSGSVIRSYLNNLRTVSRCVCMAAFSALPGTFRALEVLSTLRMSCRHIAEAIRTT